MDWVIVGQSVVRREEAAVNPFNRGFRYGDGCFETIGVMNGVPVFWHQHVRRLHRALKFLGFDMPIGEGQLYAAVKQLLEINQFDGQGLLRLWVWRSGHGAYAPESDQSEFLAEVSPLARPLFPVPVVAVRATILPERLLPLGEFGNHKWMGKTINVHAAGEAKRRGFDDALLLNSAGRITESTSSNIVLNHNGRWITPPLTEGCLAGVVREVMLTQAGCPVRVSEEVISETMVNEASAIFSSNSAWGIRPFGQLNTKELRTDQADQLQQWLLAEAINSASDFQENRQ